ncbi:MAG: sel1 repeat family protein, partial [Oscillospiraceae bacterium]|nr:sel1 repeat family protein [Oscillospiraceae bacterium]
LAICYMKGFGVEQSRSSTVQWLSKAARQGHIDAQFSLCPCYQYGIGTKKNTKHMVYWFKKAASGCIKRGDAEAMCKLGHAHLNRDIVGEILLDEAQKCFRYALKLDAECADAHFGLGEVCYYRCVEDTKQTFLSKTVAVLQKITVMFAPVEIFGSGDAEREVNHVRAEHPLMRTFLQTPEGKTMMEHYRTAAEYGYTLAQKRIGELESYLT